MKYYFAPLEGVTDAAFRRIHQKYYGGVDRYYTPFFSPTAHQSLTPREQRELPPYDGKTVPQVLTKTAADFVWFAGQCRDLGYEEVNLNLGCPSGTVTSKGKGAGMLRDLESLNRFFQEVFRDCPLPVSVKTRIGYESPEEFPAILALLNRYPIREVIVHPRVRSQLYRGGCHMEAFGCAQEHAAAALCYNGNLCSTEEIGAFAAGHPTVDAVMLGRGLVGNPGMLRGVPVEQAYTEELLETYLEDFGGSRNAMFRMKEHWRYLLCKFENAEKLGKRLRKTTDLKEYRQTVAEIFAACPQRTDLSPDW